MFNAVEFEHMRENFLSEDDPLFLVVKRIEKVERDDRGVSFTCTARQFSKGIMPALFIQNDHALLPKGEDDCVTIRIDLLTDHLFRFRLVRGPIVPSRTTEMIAGTFDGPIEFTLEETDSTVVITTPALKLTVEKNPWSLTVHDTTGKQLLRQYTGDTHSVSHIVKEQVPDLDDSYCCFESYPFSLVRDQNSGREWYVDAFLLHPDEHFYGFGEKFGPLDKLGQEVLIWHCDATGTSTAKSYKNVPFFMSTRGYGVFVNSSTKTRFLMGSYHYKTFQILCREGEADWYFIHGPSMKQILSRYTDITGKPRIVPKWSFGIWMSKNTYRSQDEVLEVARKIREEHIPCDVIHLDVGWFERDWMCDYEFAPNRFPDPAAMIRKLENMGLRLSMWQLPYLKKENKLYPEAAERGYFARNGDGTVSTREADGVIDFSNPEAVSWYKGLIGGLLKLGASVIKADFGESSEDSAEYHGYSGNEMHNLYPLLYGRAVFEETERIKGEGILWGRSAFAGSQRYPLHWGGDANSDFPGMYHSLRGGLSFGLSGFPFWSHDVGGYFCEVDPEVYIRWAQMGTFSSHMRLHGTTSREPWNFGPEIEQIFLAYARLRYRLLPYIYSEAVHCCRESLPMMRALVLEFQEDPTTYSIDDQYLFGSCFLAAPVIDSVRERKVYLPAGAEWIDFWTEEVHSGGKWVTVPVPLDRIPLFVRKGSIIPMGEQISSIDEAPLKRVFYHIYPEKEAEYRFFHTPFESIHLRLRTEEQRISVDIEPSSIPAELHIHTATGISVIPVPKGTDHTEIDCSGGDHE